METLSLKTQDSFEQVMKKYTPTVYRIALTRLGDPTEAEDAAQDVFLRYFKADITFESEEHRKAWLIRCAVNRANSVAASAWFRHRAGSEVSEYPEGAKALSENAAFSDPTAEYSEAAARRRGILDAVMRLPSKYRTVIYLFYFEDMSIAEIGKATKTKQPTVRSQLSRARDMLKQHLLEVDLDEI